MLKEAFCSLAEFENSYFGGGGVFRWPGNREGYFSDDFAPVFFSHDEGLAKAPLHLIDGFDGRRIPAGYSSYGAQLIDVESHISTVAGLRLIGEEVTVSVGEKLFAADGFAATGNGESLRELCQSRGFGAVEKPSVDGSERAC
jgi:hypothetical protein